MVLTMTGGTLGASSTGEPTTTAPASRPTTPLEQVYETLRLTDAESMALAVVADRTSQLDEPAFTILLGRVAKLPAMEGRRLVYGLDHPAYRSLLARPWEYRGRSMQMTVTPANVGGIYVRKMLPGKDFTPTRHWTIQDGPIWKIYCFNADSVNPIMEPMVVFSTTAPVALGEPDEVQSDGTEVFGGRRRLDIAGVFYKIYRQKDRQGTWRNYPVVLAWQIDKSARAPGGDQWQQETRWRWVFAVALLLMMGYMFYKRGIKVSNAPSRKYTYRPLRFDTPGGAAEEDANTDGTDVRTKDDNGTNNQDSPGRP